MQRASKLVIHWWVLCAERDLNVVIHMHICCAERFQAGNISVSSSPMALDKKAKLKTHHLNMVCRNLK